MHLINDEHSFIKRLPGFQHAEVIKPVLKGYSQDKKYHVQAGQKHYLVKIFDKIDTGAKQAEFAALKAMEQYDVSCSRALELGEWDAAEAGYMILSYIEGEDAAEVLPSLTQAEQYRIGITAGQQLKKIHQYDAAPSMRPWHERKLAKHQAYMASYEQLGIAIPHDEKVIAFINEHSHLMEGRPDLFQHDDYHPSNLVIKERALAGVIDFNRCDWGDPIHEFLKVGMFSVDVSVPFSIGQIDGYFDAQPPPELFWKLYTLYSAMSLISSIVWINKVKPEETAQMMELITKVIDDHHEFDSIVPSWYDKSKLLL